MGTLTLGFSHGDGLPHIVVRGTVIVARFVTKSDAEAFLRMKSQVFCAGGCGRRFVEGLAPSPAAKASRLCPSCTPKEG